MQIDVMAYIPILPGEHGNVVAKVFQGNITLSVAPQVGDYIYLDNDSGLSGRVVRRNLTAWASAPTVQVNFELFRKGSAGLELTDNLIEYLDTLTCWEDLGEVTICLKGDGLG